MGAWVSYGLGSMNENLPTCVVLPDHRGLGPNGTKNWDAAFLPSSRQGTVIFPNREVPINDLYPAKQGTFITRDSHREGVELINQLGRAHAESRDDDPRLEARIRSYELAARMQLAAPEALDTSDEPEHVLKLYGLDHIPSAYDKEINAREVRIGTRHHDRTHGVSLSPLEIRIRSS